MTPEIKRILLVRFKSIGDILFTLPAVHAVRENFPDAKITFMVSRENAALLEGFRDVNEVIAVDRSIYRRGNPARIIGETFSLLRRLYTGRFSLTVDFQGYGETALLTRITRAPERWGTVYHTGRRWAYTHGVNRDDRIHPAESHLSMLKQCGLKLGAVRNEFVLPPDAQEQACRFFEAHKLQTCKPTLFIQPFTSREKKNWPVEKYLELAGWWQNQGMQVLFGGGPAERDALEPMRAAGFPVAAGVPLLVAGGLVNLSSVILGGDTGLLHLAVAMNKRVVMIMNGKARNQTYPFQHPEWVISPEEGIPLASIETGTVIQMCERALAELNANTAGNKTQAVRP